MMTPHENTADQKSQKYKHRKNQSIENDKPGGLLKMLGISNQTRDTVESFADLARIKVFGKPNND